MPHMISTPRSPAAQPVGHAPNVATGPTLLPIRMPLPKFIADTSLKMVLEKQATGPQISAASWQELSSGQWEELPPDDSARLEQAYVNGEVRLQTSLRGRQGTAVLEGNPWTHIGTSGAAQPIRRLLNRSRSAMVEDDIDFLADSLVKPSLPEGKVASFTQVRPASGDWSALQPIDEEPFTPRHVTSAVDVERVFVWRRNEWHPVSDSQHQQILVHLRNGVRVFDIYEGPYSWTVDASGKDDWYQISKTTGRRRAMKCQLQTGFPTPRLPRNPSIGVPTSNRSNGSHFPGQEMLFNYKSTARVMTPKGDWAMSFDEFTEQELTEMEQELTLQSRSRSQTTSLTDRLRQEWDALRGSIAAGQESTGHSFTQDELTKAWLDSGGRAGVEYKNLIVQSIADMFLKIDLSRNDKIEEAEWLHYWLLENQAPSFHALSQVNEKLLQWLKQDPEVLSRLNKLFLENSDSRHDAQLTACQMRKVAREWLEEQQHCKSQAAALKQDLVLYLKELLASKDMIDEDDLFSYYDFMNHMLGRRKATVQLYQYDLSNGGAKWLSPLLVGQQLEGIWHTSIVVHDREYWYGGPVLESSPGGTPFGAPSKIFDLPEQTMRTKTDFVNHIARVLAHDFTVNSYDALTHNCNHFSDACCLFLLNSHIPQDVLTQPELVMGTWSMQLLRPVLNRALGRFEANGTAKECERTRGTSVASPEQQALIPIGTLVIWEHDEGWTRIARVIARCEDKQTCALKWIDVHTGELRTETQVDISRLQRLESSSSGQRRRSSGPMVGGLFGARFHKQPVDL